MGHQKVWVAWRLFEEYPIVVPEDEKGGDEEGEERHVPRSRERDDVDE